VICVITVGTKVKITRRLYVGDDGWAFEIFLRVFFFFLGFLIKVEDGRGGMGLILGLWRRGMEGWLVAG